MGWEILPEIRNRIKKTEPSGGDEDRIYSSYQEMAEKESKREDGIDFVSIVTPNHTHYAITKCFLEHGIHVVCEKPMTRNVEEAEEIAALAAQKDLEVCVPYTYAHYPAIRECRSLIEAGRIGKIIDVAAEYHQDWMILGLNNDEEDFTKWIGDPGIRRVFMRRMQICTIRFVRNFLTGQMAVCKMSIIITSPMYKTV